MSILVAYASRHGATGQIAQQIAENLREAGEDAEARPVQEAVDLDDYEGIRSRQREPISQPSSHYGLTEAGEP